MADLIELIMQVGSFLFLLGLGYGFGWLNEKRHLARLAVKEAELQGIGVISLRKLPATANAECVGLVSGSVVIATDYFKVIAGALRNLFGGEVRAFQTLATRARREAIVRMLEEAKSKGANAVINVRLETCTIGGQQNKKPGGVEIIAYGTALIC